MGNFRKHSPSTGMFRIGIPIGSLHGRGFGSVAPRGKVFDPAFKDFFIML